MLLVVDVGNSQTSFGILEYQTWRHHWRVETKASQTADEYASFLFPLLDRAGLGRQTFEGIAICSVVPAVEDALESFCQDYFHLLPFKVHGGLELGFQLNVHTPGEVGADRLANAAYAVEKMKLPAIVVDFGTATTFDVVSADRVYQGGIILPGVRLGVQSLSAKTAKLPSIDLKFPRSVIGKSTVECIQSGILYGYCDLIDGLLTRLEKELGDPAEVALTGGLAFLFHGRLTHAAKFLPNLTLEGIELLFRRNA